MATNWAYQFCLYCSTRLCSPGELCCDRCEYDLEVKAAQIEAEAG